MAHRDLVGGELETHGQFLAVASRFGDHAEDRLVHTSSHPACHRGRCCREVLAIESKPRRTIAEEGALNVCLRGGRNRGVDLPFPPASLWIPLRLLAVRNGEEEIEEVCESVVLF